MEEWERAFVGFCFAAASVGVITWLAVDRGWFKKGAP
jgi:hypothetical protein